MHCILVTIVLYIVSHSQLIMQATSTPSHTTSSACPRPPPPIPHTCRRATPIRHVCPHLAIRQGVQTRALAARRGQPTHPASGTRAARPPRPARNHRPSLATTPPPVRQSPSRWVRRYPSSPSPDHAPATCRDRRVGACFGAMHCT